MSQTIQKKITWSKSQELLLEVLIHERRSMAVLLNLFPMRTQTQIEAKAKRLGYIKRTINGKIQFIHKKQLQEIAIHNEQMEYHDSSDIYIDYILQNIYLLSQSEFYYVDTDESELAVFKYKFNALIHDVKLHLRLYINHSTLVYEVNTQIYQLIENLNKLLGSLFMFAKEHPFGCLEMQQHCRKLISSLTQQEKMTLSRPIVMADIDDI